MLAAQLCALYRRAAAGPLPPQACSTHPALGCTSVLQLVWLPAPGQPATLQQGHPLPVGEVQQGAARRIAIHPVGCGNVTTMRVPPFQGLMCWHSHPMPPRRRTRRPEDMAPPSSWCCPTCTQQPGSCRTSRRCCSAWKAAAGAGAEAGAGAGAEAGAGAAARAAGAVAAAPGAGSGARAAAHAAVTAAGAAAGATVALPATEGGDGDATSWGEATGSRRGYGLASRITRPLNFSLLPRVSLQVCETLRMTRCHLSKNRLSGLQCRQNRRSTLSAPHGGGGRAVQALLCFCSAVSELPPFCTRSRASAWATQPPGKQWRTPTPRPLASAPRPAAAGPCGAVG